MAKPVTAAAPAVSPESHPPHRDFLQITDFTRPQLVQLFALAERMRMILAKQMEVADAESRVPPAEEAVDAAKESLSDARAKVQAVRAEVFDIIRGQSLLF